MQFPIPSAPPASQVSHGAWYRATKVHSGHSWWPRLQQNQLALWLLSQGPQGGLMGENTAFSRLWGKRIACFLLSAATFSTVQVFLVYTLWANFSPLFKTVSPAQIKWP